VWPYEISRDFFYEHVPSGGIKTFLPESAQDMRPQLVKSIVIIVADDAELYFESPFRRSPHKSLLAVRENVALKRCARTDYRKKTK
jgi:hypothetical protein